MNTGTEGTNLVAGPVAAGPFLNFKAPGVNILGNHRISGLVTIGGRGIRGAIGFMRGYGVTEPDFLYFNDAHVPTMGSATNWRTGTGGFAMGAALAGPFSKVDSHRDAVTNFTGPVVISGRLDKPSGLGFIVGEGMTATMLWGLGAFVLGAGSPAQFYAL